jgi:thioredoxin reductase
MKKPSLKGSLGSELGEKKVIEKQDLNIPAVKETVTEIHKPQNHKEETETKGVFIKIGKELHKEIKKYCVLHDLDMQGYYLDAIMNKAKFDKII